MIIVINQDWLKLKMISSKRYLEAIPPPSNLSSPETQVGLDILLMGDGDFGHVMQRYYKGKKEMRRTMKVKVAKMRERVKGKV